MQRRTLTPVGSLLQRREEGLCAAPSMSLRDAGEPVRYDSIHCDSDVKRVRSRNHNHAVDVLTRQ